MDAFTSTAFCGNPAGVVVLDAPADPAWMQAVAAEFKHAETAFVVADGSEGADGGEPKSLRWFTPTTEVDLCGHATLATAYILGGSQRFDTRSGTLNCTSTGDGIVEMDFPSVTSQPVRAPEELTTALPGVTVESVARGDFDLLVQVASAAEVRALRPDLDTLARIPTRAVIVTAPGDREGVDVVSRVFAPRVGIGEDPVTGSAHCALASWWSAALGRTAESTELIGEQASPRGGLVRMTLHGSRVGLAGRAVTILRGELLA
ncbi:PhzF family phenazine biosynthesis protein [Halopolyspora algeriensis]|uniref:PhzF family phenazine biosynthesis protein n=1 Tax=Halopolyspora algeriensis TaxID=1500506 RepID=A0A368VUF7_9ACTN|nr:PhzF family phenazine biosynthesis protein [Halopolyspora algeriensis]TQM47609.1 PhzF family phenazine biosynthesis protein [Halopolyspora algeriensis]